MPSALKVKVRKAIEQVPVRAMKTSALTLTIVNNQGTGDVEYGKIYDVYFPPSELECHTCDSLKRCDTM